MTEGMYPCVICPRMLNTLGGQRKHRVAKHRYCVSCNEDIGPYVLDILEHHVQYHELERCYICTEDQFFASKEALHEHRSTRHAAVYCIPCRRMFIGPGQLYAHNKSSKHTKRDVACYAANKGCSMKFVSTSAMIAHLETETCVSGVTHGLLDNFMIYVDYSGLITGSAAPGVPLYHCPDKMCGKRATTLSGIMQHIESPAPCADFSTHIDNLLSCLENEIRQYIS